QIMVQSMVKALPDAITVDVSRMRQSDKISVTDLQWAEGVTPLTSPETVLAATKQLRGMAAFDDDAAFAALDKEAAKADSEAYEGGLLLTPLERELERSAAQYAARKEKGDRLDQPRMVDFKFLLPTAEASHELSLHLAQAGHSVQDKGLLETKIGPMYALDTSLKSSIEPEKMAQLSAGLRERTEELGGVFQGWGAALVAPRPLQMLWNLLTGK
ncbi:MAG: ribonuclease E inhibitor RraB, partial [Armatimonadota bacterium]